MLRHEVLCYFLEESYATLLMILCLTNRNWDLKQIVLLGALVLKAPSQKLHHPTVVKREKCLQTATRVLQMLCWSPIQQVLTFLFLFLDDGEGDDGYNTVTCYCGKPFAGRPMIECSHCLTWIHLSCARIRRTNIPDEFICAKCREKGVITQLTNQS